MSEAPDRSTSLAAEPMSPSGIAHYRWDLRAARRAVDEQHTEDSGHLHVVRSGAVVALSGEIDVATRSRFADALDGADLVVLVEDSGLPRSGACGAVPEHEA